MLVILLLGFVLCSRAENEYLTTEADVETGPITPTNLTVTMTSQFATLTSHLSDNTEDSVDGYLLRFGFNISSLESVTISGNQTTYNAYYLRSSTVYYFILQSFIIVNGKPVYSKLVSVIDTTPPPDPITPTNLTVTMTSQFATLTWHLSENPKDSVEGYLLRFGFNISSLDRVTISGYQTTYKVYYLRSSTVYYFILQSFIIVNGKPVYSKGVSAIDTTPPPALGPPRDLTVDHSFSAPEVTVLWYKPKYPVHIDGYLIEWCSEGICNKSTCNDTSSSRVEYLLTGLSVAEIYDVNVFSYVIYKNEPFLSSPARIRFQVRSPPPDNVTATTLAPTAALISWTLRTPSRLLRTRIICAGRTYFENATVGSFACNGFKPWSLQSVEVDLCPVANGFCSASKSATFFTPPEIFPPPIVSSEPAYSSSMIAIRLEEPESYQKYSGFHIEYCSSSQSCNILYVNSGSKTVVLRNLRFDTRYDITVRAFIKTGSHKHFSKPAKATERTFKLVPEAPVDLQAKALSGQAVYLSWKIYNSIVYKSEISYDGELKIKTYGNDKDAVIHGLKPRKTYVFRVRCCGSLGCGQETSVVVVTKTGVPDAPRNFTAVRKTPGQIAISWEAPENWNALNTGYLLQWKCDTNSDAVRLEYTVNYYTIFTEDKDCKVSLAAFSVDDDDMLRSGEPVHSDTVK